MQLTCVLIPMGCLVMGTLAQTASNSTSSTSLKPGQLSTDSQFDMYLQEVLALANGGGANTGEVLRAASQIEPGDFDSFYSEFKILGDAIHDQAVSAEKAGFGVSAREAYFRSANYYRSADFFLHGNTSDPRLTTLWDAQLADFEKAIKLLPNPGEKINIKTRNYTIPVIFYPGATNKAGSKEVSCSGTKPTVLIGSGYDGAQEALLHGFCSYVIVRGWNCATYEGPGQPTVRRQQNIGFVPDWWNVVTPIIDYLEKRPDVDGSRLALAGESFGGLLAPIAASREHRVAAVMALDGIHSLFDAIIENFPLQLTAPFKAGNASAFDATIHAMLASGRAPTQLRWGVDQGTWSFNTQSPYDWLHQTQAYDIDAKVLGNITCPMFIGAGESDAVIPPEQARWVADLVGDRGYYHLFKTDLGAGEHCQIGAEGQLAMASLNWLAKVFNQVSKNRNNY